MLKSHRLAVFALLFSSSLFADGVLEINQACAENAGCFPGDTAGFPVTIANAGSYRLTSNIDVTSISGTNAIEITTSSVRLDLGGFQLRGPTNCTGSIGIDFTCTPQDPSANGITVSAQVVGTTIHNGTIRGMPNNAVSAGSALMTRIANLLVTNSGAHGLALGNRTQVVDSRIYESWLSGVFAGDYSMLGGNTSVRNAVNGLLAGNFSTANQNIAQDNGGNGFLLGHSSKFGANTSTGNLQEDRCGGGMCTSLKRFYLTEATVDGSQPLTACTSGFHMAAQSELQNPNNLQYDHVLGLNQDDVGLGAVTNVAGWIRTGMEDDSINNCSTWTADEAPSTGAVLALPDAHNFWEEASTQIAPWISLFPGCQEEWHVWCAED